VRVELSPLEIERYSRHLLLEGVGREGQLRLREGSVLCVGAGGLGSPALLYLAAAGVGRIGIIDFDRVERSNLQRQILHTDASVGRSKVDSARERLLALNPDLRIDVYEEAFTVDNALARVSDYAVVIDGTDNFATRYLVNDACVLAGKPLVYGSIFKFEGQASVFNYRGGPHYRDLYPEPPPEGSVPSCGEAGVLGVLPGVIGALQATEALKILLDIGTSLSGRLLLYDALQLTFRELTFQADPNRPPIRTLEPVSVACGGSDAPTVDVAAFRRRRAEGWAPFLVDVRRAAESAIVSIPGTDLRVDHDAVREHRGALPRDRDLVVYCKRGARGAAACEALRAEGFERVWNLAGGIEAWIAGEDVSVPRY
jgi:molybdopterin/thiamine biosynthesis adenylyltransferase/rhodanese-related sulfurtransferase